MSEPDPTIKAAALADLRIWRTWTDRRDPLIYAAHRAGASLSEIHIASLVAVNTARAAIASQEEAMNAAAPVDPLNGLHHPNFISTTPGRFPGLASYTWRPFTGRETSPDMLVPDASRLSSLSPEHRETLRKEYEAAENPWATARFMHQARSYAGRAAGAWTAYVRATGMVERAFADLTETADGMWRAGVMKLAGLQDDAIKAAVEWDAVGRELADRYKQYEEYVGYERANHLEQLLGGLDVDTSEWEVHSAGEYTSEFYITDFSPPCTKKTTELVENQRERLKKVAELTGER